MTPDDRHTLWMLFIKQWKLPDAPVVGVASIQLSVRELGLMYMNHQTVFIPHAADARAAIIKGFKIFDPEIASQIAAEVAKDE